MIPDLDWQDGAACRGQDPDLFFPESYQNVNEARKVCARCEVLKDCLAYAMSAPDARKFGVWAGTTPRERDRIARQRRHARRMEEAMGRK